MNKVLLLIGMWFALFLLIAILLAYTQTKKELQEGSCWILVTSFIVTTAITFILGGLIF